MSLIPNWPSIPSIEEELLKHLERIRALEALVFQVDAQFDIKVTADSTFFIVGNGKFFWMVPSDLDGWFLVEVEAFLSTAGSTSTTVQIANTTTGFDMLTTVMTIDSSERTTCTAAIPPVISTTRDLVTACDILRIDIDLAGTGAKGLGVIATFARERRE